MLLFIGGYWVLSGQRPWNLFRHVIFKECQHTLFLFFAQIIYSGLIQIVFVSFQAKGNTDTSATQTSAPDRWPLFFQSALGDLFNLMNEEFVAIGFFLAFAAILIHQFHIKHNKGITASLFVSMFFLEWCILLLMIGIFHKCYL